jgi:hypothetical protein
LPKPEFAVIFFLSNGKVLLNLFIKIRPIFEKRKTITKALLLILKTLLIGQSN